MANNNNENNSHSVLQDHIKKGKKFIPPFVHELGNLQEVSWINEMIPEVIWVALLLHNNGFMYGVDLAEKLSKTAFNIQNSKVCSFFGRTSCFSELNKNNQTKLIEQLTENNIIEQIQNSLSPLNNLYPSSPLRFLSQTISQTNFENDLITIKLVLDQLYNRRSQFATRVQSTIFYIGVVCGRVVVSNSTALSEFPEVEHYPETELSKQIASEIRASLNLFFGLDGKKSVWSRQFWNRGLKLEKCSLPYNEDVK